MLSVDYKIAGAALTYCHLTIIKSKQPVGWAAWASAKFKIHIYWLKLKFEIVKLQHFVIGKGGIATCTAGLQEPLAS